MLNTLFGNRVDIAIARFKQFEPTDGYYLAFSGGKDSCVILDLAKKAGVKFDAHMNLTVDPPELIQFVRKYHPEVTLHRPERTMWELIVAERMPPTRTVRYCCAELKERGGIGRLVVTGIRGEESQRRKKRQMVELCRTNPGRRFLHVIIDWSESDVWDYIRGYDLPYCCLYDEEDRDRIGCIMCPQGGPEKMKRDALRWPRTAGAYKRAMQKCYEKRIADGLETEWKSGEDMYEWWISGKGNEKENEAQGRFFFE